MSLLNRTFHPDEANQAFTTGRLLETGVYNYDPKDHHGPTLYYAAAAVQKAAGHGNIASIDGNLLRCTPLFFAILALALTMLTAKKIFTRSGIGWTMPSSIITGLLATSPIFVFFATDFIQEMLLACFTVMMIWSATGYAISLSKQISQNAKPAKIKPGTWALTFGIAAGLAFATKETALLAFTAIAAAAAFIRFAPDAKRSLHAFLAISGFALTAVMLYSSFAANWQGVFNAFVAAPLSYIRRAAGDSVSAGAAYHVHPWWQYIRWIFTDNVPLAAFIVAGSLCGLVEILRDRSKALIPAPLKASFTASLTFSISLTLFYSVIPYKTPWCALQMHIPLLCTGFLGFLITSLRGITGRVLMVLFTALLLYRNARIVGNMCSDPDSRQIPYNYASASPQVKEMANLIRSIVSANNTSDGAKTFAAVALPSEDTWPLPFYLRDLDANVGYWTQFAELEALAGLGRNPDIVIVPAEDGHLVQPLFPYLKNTKRFEMRNRVRVRVFWRPHQPSTTNSQPL